MTTRDAVVCEGWRWFLRLENGRMRLGVRNGGGGMVVVVKTYYY